MEMESNPAGQTGDLGNFERIVMTAVLMLGEGYGVPIYDKVTALSGKHVNQGSLYLTLDRLEAKGLLACRASDPAKEPRGRSKHYYSLTKAGLHAMKYSAENAQRLNELFEEHYEKKRLKARLAGETV
jgi:DNA-binding PadR family transcriptional regulator